MGKEHSELKLRLASIEDQSLLEYWDTKQHVIDCDPEGPWDWKEELGKKVSWREQFVAEVDGRPIGFVQIIDPHFEETHYWGEVDKHLRAIDIWIGEASDLGKGYGTKMMKLIIELCFIPPDVTAIIIDPLSSNIKAIKFYHRLGFEFVETKYFAGSTCDVHRLPRKKWDSEMKVLNPKG